MEGSDVASLHQACCKQGLGKEEAWLRNIILLVLHNQEALRLALRLCDFRWASVGLLVEPHMQRLSPRNEGQGCLSAKALEISCF